MADEADDTAQCFQLPLALMAALREDEDLSGTDEERVIQALGAYLRAHASKGLINAGGHAPEMLDIPRR